MDITELLKEKSKYLNISAIEHDLNFATGTLSRVLNDKRKLTSDQNNKLTKLFNSYFGVQIEQTIKTEAIKEAKQVKPGAGCVNIKDYKLLLSGKYQHIKSGDKVTLIKKDNQYFIA